MNKKKRKRKEKRKEKKKGNVKGKRKIKKQKDKKPARVEGTVITWSERLRWISRTFSECEAN